MKKRIGFAALAVLVAAVPAALAAEFSLLSPDGKLSVTIDSDKQLTWAVSHDGTSVIEPSAIGLTLVDGTEVGRNAKVRPAGRRTVDTTFDTPVYKKSLVRDSYNELVLKLNGGFSVEFRAYDDGAAYRFVADRKADRIVADEKVEFSFAGDYKAFVPYVNDLRGGYPYSYSFESYYDEVPLSGMASDSLAIVPLLVELPQGKKALLMEGNLLDYPGMFLTRPAGTEGNVLAGRFAPYPSEGQDVLLNDRNVIPGRCEDYIAVVCRGESLPWRAVVVSTSDTQLADCDMAQRLGSPSRIADPSWIKPGKVAWDWWNASTVKGVDFKGGMNTDTYKYFIDFAAENGLEYIIVDEGWSRGSLMTPVPEMDIPAIVGYGASKGVGVILWASWLLTDAEKEVVFPHYAGMGVKGFKVDFFDRDDQPVVRSMTEIARLAAENHLLVDYHGMKATGIQRAYPNVVNFEGVKGLENCKWAVVDDRGPVDDMLRYDVTIPYIRMAAGPMDYTPGAMNNASRANFRPVYGAPMGQGTRVHQMAMYTVFEAPLQMLADSPSAYRANQECTDFIAEVPTVFDETRVLAGSVGEYVAIARRKGAVWYVGAMTDWTPREIEIDLSFLGDGTYSGVVFRDGVNAATAASDYRREELTASASDRLTASMAPGGGWTAVFKPAE